MGNRVERFEDLEIWRKSTELAIALYGLLKICKDYSLRDQIQRSAVSISSNIAEGFERNSNKEFIQYLYIAKGSCGELRTQIYIAMEVEIIRKAKGEALTEKAKLISAMIANLIKTRKQNF